MVKHSRPVCLASVEDRVQLTRTPQRWLCICLRGVCLCTEFILAWKGLNGLVFFLILSLASCNDASLGCAGQHKLFWKRMQFVLPGFVNNSCLFAPSWAVVYALGSKCTLPVLSMGSCWRWDKVVVFFTQVSICSHFGVMGVPVALLEHLAGLIASFAETWRDGSFTVPKSVPKSSSLNKMDLAHMLFCITAGTPGSCFGITSRVRNEWEVAKRGMCGVIKLERIQLKYTH